MVPYIFQLIFGIFFIFLVWKLIVYVIEVNNTEHGIHYVEHQRPSLHLESIDCPFKFHVNCDSASFSGIQCTVKSVEPCLVKVFWGVPFDCLISLMNSDINFLRKAVTAYDPSEMMPCIDHHVPQLIPAHEEASMEYKPRSHTEPSLSNPGNKLLVSFMFLIVLENDSAIKDSTVVAMANVVHVSNANNPLPTGLKYQFIKLSSGVIGNVQQIYHASSQDNSCLICYSQPASVVFLPCRHCSLCYRCYNSMKALQDGFQDRCPVCRQIPQRLFQLPSLI